MGVAALVGRAAPEAGNLALAFWRHGGKAPFGTGSGPLGYLCHFALLDKAQQIAGKRSLQTAHTILKSLKHSRHAVLQPSGMASPVPDSV